MENQLFEKFQDRYLPNLGAEMVLCPFCQGPYIEANFCTSCEKKVVVDRLGTPFGKKSFYGIKKSYLEGASWLLKIFPSFENRKSSRAIRYKNELLFRLKTLCNDSLQLEEFKIELRDLINELVLYEKDIGRFKKQMESLDPTMRSLILLDIEESSLFQTARHPVSRWLNGRVYYIQRRVYISLALLIAILLLFISHIPKMAETILIFSGR